MPTIKNNTSYLFGWSAVQSLVKYNWGGQSTSWLFPDNIFHFRILEWKKGNEAKYPKTTVSHHILSSQTRGKERRRLSIPLPSTGSPICRLLDLSGSVHLFRSPGMISRSTFSSFSSFFLFLVLSPLWFSHLWGDSFLFQHQMSWFIETKTMDWSLFQHQTIPFCWNTDLQMDLAWVCCLSCCKI